MRSFHQNMLVDLVKPPAVWADATLPASYIDMSDYAFIVFLIFTGAMDTGDTLDVKAVQAVDAAGTDSKDITGAAITQLVITDDDALATIEVRDTALDIANGFRFVSLIIDETGTPAAGSIVALRYAGGGLAPTQPVKYVEQVQVS